MPRPSWNRVVGSAGHVHVHTGVLSENCLYCLLSLPPLTPTLIRSRTFSFWESSTFPPPRLFRGFSQHIWSESGVVWSKWRKEALIFEEKWILSVVGVSLHFYILRVAKIMSFVTKRLVYIWYMCVLLKFTVEFPSVKNAEEKQNNQWECVAWVCNVCAPRVDVLTSLFEIWSHSRKSPQSSLLRTTWLNDLRTW